MDKLKNDSNIDYVITASKNSFKTKLKQKKLRNNYSSDEESDA